MADGSVEYTGHDYLNILIITVGTVVTAFIGLLVARTQREKSPRSTVESNDNEERRAAVARVAAQDALVASFIIELQQDNAKMEDECRDYRTLREAVLREGKDPDALIRTTRGGRHGHQPPSAGNAPPPAPA